jgi:hypothetical protein
MNPRGKLRKKLQIAESIICKSMIKWVIAFARDVDPRPPNGV